MTCVVRTYSGVPGRTPMVGRGMGKVATTFTPNAADGQLFDTQHCPAAAGVSVMASRIPPAATFSKTSSEWARVMFDHFPDVDARPRPGN